MTPPSPPPQKYARTFYCPGPRYPSRSWIRLLARPCAWRLQSWASATAPTAANGCLRCRVWCLLLRQCCLAPPPGLAANGYYLALEVWCLVLLQPGSATERLPRLGACRCLTARLLTTANRCLRCGACWCCRCLARQLTATSTSPVLGASRYLTRLQRLPRLCWVLAAAAAAAVCRSCSCSSCRFHYPRCLLFVPLLAIWAEWSVASPWLAALVACLSSLLAGLTSRC